MVIRLYSTFDGNSPEMMHIVLDASLHLDTLGLYSNSIGSAGASIIADFLASNPQLKSLHLKDNNLNDADAAILANSLQSNTNLQWIDLEDNNDITEVGRRVLLESVFDVSSLNACAASNHTCQISGLNPDIYDINGEIESKCNRAMKIFTILSKDDGFNLNCLGDVSYKLIPHVLSLAQDFIVANTVILDAYFEQTGQYSGDWNEQGETGLSYGTSSMFELLRSWAVPSLSD